MFFIYTAQLQAVGRKTGGPVPEAGDQCNYVKRGV